MRRDQQGRKYYANHNTQMTQYEDPRKSVIAATVVGQQPRWIGQASALPHWQSQMPPTMVAPNQLRISRISMSAVHQPGEMAEYYELIDPVTFDRFCDPVIGNSCKHKHLCANRSV
jgi:hypothetical protein